ncbi:unnamed protein product, partial [Mesorhabditis belari]|uniref:Uncharacterized protein n=1 Tax=Mesorhabditis belari TaxID=2138241 RepID=A0AAF3E8L0_9BILA
MYTHQDLPKHDFMMVKPPRSEADFHAEYDPSIGYGTAFILLLFFFLITIKGIVKWAIMKAMNVNERQEEILAKKKVLCGTPLQSIVIEGNVLNQK